MGLFPRKINGQYAMIARQDNENLYLIYSDDLYSWDGGVAILKPQFPWEFVQIGNCGAPIELDEGWLLLTHGVGPVRKYAIGAVLLDKADPSKVLARTREPLVRPEPSEREGYVPNVVYTCGAMRHGDPDHPALCDIGYVLDFRDPRDRRLAGRHGRVTCGGVTADVHYIATVADVIRYPRLSRVSSRRFTCVSAGTPCGEVRATARPAAPELVFDGKPVDQVIRALDDAAAPGSVWRRNQHSCRGLICTTQRAPIRPCMPTRSCRWAIFAGHTK